MAYLFLTVAIFAEVLATSALTASEQFSRLWPSVFTILGYAVAFYFLSLALKSIPVGVAYAIWSGLGIVLISVAGLFVFKQKLDFYAWLGIAFIIAGVLIINILSKSAVH